jgi:transglutaminase-like putative cysteine protease
MAPELSRLVRRLTFALLVLAAVATEVAAVDSRSVLTSGGTALVWVGLAALLGRFVPVPTDCRRSPPRFVFWILLTLAVAPFLVEPIHRRWNDEGHPLELQMVFALRSLGLGLAAFAAWLLCLRLACVVSLFLMLFAVTMTDHPAVMVLLGLYSATGSVWLMLVYWTGLRRFFVASDTAVALEVQPGRERLPWLAVFLAVGLVGCVLGLIAVGPRRAARVLAEWLPTSGGTGDYDPFARGGVNDGDDEVKGENARGTGMTSTDSFLDSPLPSLYDMFSDMYGEPFKPNEREQSIALDGSNQVREGNKPPADNLRPNREFPTVRKSPRRPRDLSNRAARALFEVQGRTPLHVRAAAFDTFDGLAWREAPTDRQSCWIDKEPNSCWMKPRERKPTDVFAETEAHQFKITSPLGTLVPTPPHLTRFRVGRVNQAVFFAWGQERILRMAQRKTPAGIVVETECRVFDPRSLSAARLASGVSGTGKRYAETPADLAPEVASLAHRWTDNLPEGWPKIDAIVRRLRTEYSLDPSARVPEDCRDPLAHFLLHSRRGPDYQFATAAAVLPRVLGYPTRLVSGFYVAPEHYDPRTRHTPIVAEDLHFWAEVMLPSGDWLVIEPTPGYEVLGPSMSWAERVWAILAAAALWGSYHALELSSSLAVLVAMWWRRRDLFDLVAFALWRWFPGRTWQRCVRRAVRLLECRGLWAGRPRRPSQTFNAWLCLPALTPPLDHSDLDRLTRMAEWAAYAADLEPPWIDAEVRSVCRRVLGAWTLQRWRRNVPKVAESGVPP